MLFRFFKPKWQSQKAEVRLRAIEDISLNTPESNSILETLAQSDPDLGVRQAATARLDNLALLISISQKEQHDAIARSARDRLCCLVVDQHHTSLNTRQQAVDCLQSVNLLTHVVLKASEKELQLYALNALDDQDALATIIRSSSLAQLRLEAAHKVNDPSLLDTLSKETLGRDKGVSRVLRNKLSEIQSAKQQQEARNQRCEALCEALQQLAGGEYFPQYGAKLNALAYEWVNLKSSASTSQQLRAQDAIATSTAREDEVQRARIADQEAKQKAEATRQAQEALTLKLRDCASTLIQTAAQNTIPTVASADTYEQINNEWQALGADPARDRNAHKQFQSELDRCQQLVRATNIIRDQQSTIETLESEQTSAETLSSRQLEKHVRQCRALTKEIDWPRAENKAAILRTLESCRKRAEQVLKQRQQESESRFKHLEDELDALEHAINEGQSKNAVRLQKQLEQQFTTLGKSAPRTLERKLKNLCAQLNELQQWQGYAVSPKKEALCAEMEALIGSETPAQQLANKIRELQQQWRSLDATDPVHSHSLWKRFKKASDEAYKPCEAHFNNQKALREKNLQNRQQLCNQLQEYLDAVDWDQVDWKDLDHLLKRVKREWREFSPVDRSPGKKVQQQFNELLAQLEGPLKAYRQENAELKRRMIDDVETLLNSDDLTDATDLVKEIQVRWKETGPTFRSKEQALWQRFRDACNEVFDRYHQARRKESELQGSAELLVEQYCLQMEATLESFGGLTQLSIQLETLENNVEPNLDQVSPALQRRFQKLLQQLLDVRRALHSINDAEYQSLQRKAILCEQLEFSLFDLDSEEVLHAVYDAWRDDVVLPETLQQSIDQRLQTLSALAEQSQEELTECLQAQESNLRQLCIRLEIALGQPSPAEDQALRLEYQMQRLQQALAQQEQSLNLSDIKKIRCEWLCIPFNQHYPALQQRFESLINSLR